MKYKQGELQEKWRKETKKETQYSLLKPTEHFNHTVTYNKLKGMTQQVS